MRHSSQRMTAQRLKRFSFKAHFREQMKAVVSVTDAFNFHLIAKRQNHNGMMIDDTRIADHYVSLSFSPHLSLT